MARTVVALTVGLAGAAAVVAATIVLVTVDGGRRGVFLALMLSLPAVATASVTEGRLVLPGGSGWRSGCWTGRAGCC